MKKVRIIARQMIISPETGEVHSDEGLRALNGYYEDIIQVPETYDSTRIVLNFENEHPEFYGWNFQIQELA